MSLRSAFADSINTIAAEVTYEIGPQRVADLARRFGISTLPTNPNVTLSISLGSFEVTLLDMTQSFAVFMNEGRRTPAHWITKIESSRGDALYTRPTTALPQIYDKDLSHRMNEMMGRVVQSGTGTRAQLPGRDAAGKTGTSQDWRDAWFVGYTSDYTAGVWVGFDSSREMPRITGGGTPTEIWHDLMRVAHKDLPGARLPGMTAPRDSRRAREMSSFFESLAEAFGKPRRTGANPGEINPVDVSR
jgi:penicillin-binding protein 1A